MFVWEEELKGISVLSNLCPLSRKVKETTQHVFINCEVAQKSVGQLR